MLEAVAAGCSGLVNAAVSAPAERGRQSRLIGIAIAAPFPVAAAAAMLLPAVFGVPAAISLIAGASLISFLAAAVVALTGRTGLAQAVLMCLGTFSLATVVAAAGGIGSPAALVLVALPIEAWWVGRNAKAVMTGTGCMVGALALQGLAGGADMPAGVTGLAGAHWLLPIAYAACVAPRLAAWMGEDEQEAPRPSLEDLVEAVVLRMSLSGEVTEASQQARRIVGLAPEILLSGGVFDRMHVADRVPYLCAMADLRETPGFRRVMTRIRVPGSAGRSAGDFRSFELEMMRHAQDDCITMLMRAAQSEMALPDGMVAAEPERREGVSQLAAVSHELRTPLNCILGFSDMLLHEMAGPFAHPRQKEYVGLVHEAGSHLLSVVNSVLDISRLEAGTFAMEPEWFCFREAAETCRQMFAPQAEETRITLTLDIPPDAGELLADKRAVKQILINLLSNALKFTPAGGAVTISATRGDAFLTVRVLDTGIGIQEDDLGRIGEPFVQMPNDHVRRLDGAGLGLALVKGLVAQHKGSMSVESAPGQGTTVTINLPAGRRPGGAVESATTPGRLARISEENDHGPIRKTA